MDRKPAKAFREILEDFGLEDKETEIIALIRECALDYDREYGSYPENRYEGLAFFSWAVFDLNGDIKIAREWEKEMRK